MKTKPYILEKSIGYAMGRATRALGSLVNHNFAAAGYDVTCEQWSVLVHLVKKNGQSQQDLASFTCKDKTSITRLIDNMENHNLVVRIPDKDDKRQKLIYLSKKGRDLYDKLIVIIEQTLQTARRNINLKDIETCKKVLHQIYENSKL